MKEIAKFGRYVLMEAQVGDELNYVLRGPGLPSRQGHWCSKEVGLEFVELLQKAFHAGKKHRSKEIWELLRDQ